MSHEALPTVREELDRKTIDTLVQVLELAELGRITRGRVGITARAIWDATAGLVSREVMEQISKVIEEHPLPAERRQFFGLEGLVELRWRAATPGLGMVTHNPLTKERSVRLLGGPALEGRERDEKINQVAQALTGKGFIEVK